MIGATISYGYSGREVKGSDSDVWGGSDGFNPPYIRRVDRIVWIGFQTELKVGFGFGFGPESH